ncbi:MAG: arginine/lysine/ornithine decarboxylase [Nitrosomonadales bacterium]|uniref:Orn/Lys/Arg decarboxylase, major region:Orn/Lys/Arg decarboxylase, C-terminal n=1 Tax=Methylophilales bacterium HTCC2181 TaxID=383631 RepID=A0P6D2_9PROT|nr:Orn/Lys/Arg decarboxylase, major region:Orn/Lys/Arg decarboxylase, C-terminal [Methylophilales bacterium HTCC2181]MBT3513115.1 arginine/lysine/ornithine decarboxylase [Nitrosomonadales bacterium]|tara:strand:+ start:1745 stop:3988 length:2244 start_codon:yes stop_codon:yes gene_type:complete
MKFKFPIIIIDEDYRSENSSGLGIRVLAESIEKEDFEVIGVTSYVDLSSFAQQQSRASAFILAIDDEEFIEENPKALESLSKFVEEIRYRNDEIPIFLHGETKTSRHIPNKILKELNGFIHMYEDTPEFVAKYIVREAKTYLESLAPPFFRALTHYASDGSYSWHCPGHSGGVAFLKSPVGQMFHQFFGENMLRADVCNAVEELGQLLDHTGPVEASEKNAARIYKADHCYFVTNGTSTSNKMVWNSTVAPGDIVVVDRNCHKSVLHAIIMTGAIPIFLMPTRNHFGIIGPIPKEEFSWDRIKEKIKNNPFIEDKEVKPRVLTITQSTYDGILYNVEEIKEMLDGKIGALHFDEAWLPHASFHDFYGDYHAIGADRPRCEESLIFSTQSTHKMLAGLSQASQILVQDATNNKLDKELFNESYLMHSSTSPQYSIIASCDVAAAMMEEPGGNALVEESIMEALNFRRAMRKVDQEWGDGWWFKVWGPDDLSEEGIEERAAWMLNKNEKWHGFGNLAPNFNMLDPIKATIITPGLNVDGEFDGKLGIPAVIVTKYLAEHGVIVEKTGLYSFFIMFTIGITKGRWNTLVAALQQFKDDYDKNQPIWKVLPEFSQKFPIYESIGLKDLSDKIHEIFKENDIARLTTEMYLSDMVPAMKPANAFAKMAHKEIQRVPIDDLEGRITAVLLTPYPPGIPLLIPGERFNKIIVDYLKFARTFNEKFPGFETDNHGLIKNYIDGKLTYYVDCVVDN